MPIEGLPPDADLVLAQNVPAPTLSALISDEVSESPRSRLEALGLVREYAADDAVRQVYFDHRLGGRFAATWVEPGAEMTLSRGAEAFPPVPAAVVETEVPEPDEFWSLWVDSVGDHVAARFTYLEARKQVRVGLGFGDRSVLGVTTVVFRNDSIEFRCVAKKLRSFKAFVNERLGLPSDQQVQINVKANDLATALKEDLGGRIYRARAKMDATHPFDIVDVAAQDGVDLGESDRWSEFEAGQGRGRFIEFFYPTEADKHIIRVAQRDPTISFVTLATEAVVARVREAVLRHGVRD